MGTIRFVSIWWFLFIFSTKWQRWCKVLCVINCNHEVKFFSIFLMERPYYTLKYAENKNFGGCFSTDFVIAGYLVEHWTQLKIILLFCIWTKTLPNYIRMTVLTNAHNCSAASFGLPCCLSRTVLQFILN